LSHAFATFDLFAGRLGYFILPGSFKIEYSHPISNSIADPGINPQKAFLGSDVAIRSKILREDGDISTYPMCFE